MTKNKEAEKLLEDLYKSEKKEFSLSDNGNGKSRNTTNDYSKRVRTRKP